jgi:hypothetical protein
VNHPDSFAHGQQPGAAPAQDVEKFRSRVGQIIGIGHLVIGAYCVYALPALGYARWLFVLVFGTLAYFRFRPVVIIDMAGIRLRTAFKNIWIPWVAVQSIGDDGRLKITYTDHDGAIQYAKSPVYAGGYGWSREGRARIGQALEARARTSPPLTGPVRPPRTSWSRASIAVIVCAVGGWLLSDLVSIMHG